MSKIPNNITYSVGICGMGFVGSAVYRTFTKKGVNVVGYDKFKKCDHRRDDLLTCRFILLCLPTVFDSESNCYDKQSIFDTCDFLADNNFTGGVIIKSTVEPGTTEKLAKQYDGLSFVHNPEFLTARTAEEDYHNQSHIVLGRPTGCQDDIYQHIIEFHKEMFPRAVVSCCTTMESESMKIFANCFYAVKVQFFTELYMLCGKLDLDYDLIKTMIIRNGWLNPMHTDVPGPDGKVSYGGMCFPKDTNALLSYMKDNDTPCSVLEGTIKERDTMRRDNDNCV